MYIYTLLDITIFGFFRVVKLSSPNLNYVIIVGVVLLYTSVFLYTYSTEVATLQTLLCNVHAHKD